MYRYQVGHTRMVTPSTLDLTLTARQGEKLFSFLPGQYVGISFVHNHRPSAVRCFSIMSSPTEQDVLQFGIRTGGKFTRRLVKLKPGDEVWVYGPFGNFIFDAPRQKNILLCAGGIGITPFISMIRFATTAQLDNKIALIVSVRSQEDAPFIDDLRKLMRQNHNLQVSFVVGDGPTDKLHGFTTYDGRITSEIIAKHQQASPDLETGFICGPPAFMKAVTAMLEERGLPEGQIITEAFGQGKGRQVSNAHNWQFNIYALGLLGTAAASVVIMTNDLLHTIPSSILPNTLTSEAAQTQGSRRESDLDTLVNKLGEMLGDNDDSPAVIAAKKEVVDAQAKIDEVNSQNAANGAAPAPKTTAKNTTTTPTSPSTTSTSSGNTASTQPKAPAPVCTTSASGVTTCR